MPALTADRAEVWQTLARELLTQELLLPEPSMKRLLDQAFRDGRKPRGERITIPILRPQTCVGELGRYEGMRFVEQHEIPVGDDAEPWHRSAHGIAWYYLGGFGIVHDDYGREPPPIAHYNWL